MNKVKITKKYEDIPGDIKYYVKKYIQANAESLSGKIAVDFPAGKGVSSRLLMNVGAKVLSFDLFPEYFNEPGISCQKADIKNGIPLEDNVADFLLCQEGFEHFSDQIEALKEFNRILKSDARLLLTTPNYSNIRSRMSYFLAESERFNSTMPPNEFDSIWTLDNKNDHNIYYGHIFLIGIQKLRVLAKLSGFKINIIFPTRMKPTSTVLFPFVYPFILLANCIAYYKNCKKAKKQGRIDKIATYKEQLKLALNTKILLHRTLMVEFIKTMDVKDVKNNLIATKVEEKII